MRFQIIKNFATNEEIKILNEWAKLGVKNKWLDVGDLHCYFASELPHLLTKVTGEKPRILWLFSFWIPQKENFKLNASI